MTGKSIRGARACLTQSDWAAIDRHAERLHITTAQACDMAFRDGLEVLLQAIEEDEIEAMDMAADRQVDGKP